MLTVEEALASLRKMWLAASTPEDKAKIMAIAVLVNTPPTAPAPALAASTLPLRKPDSGQKEHLERVGHRIARHIRAFYRQRGIGAKFHMDDLRRHVQEEEPHTSPDSPSRIMRDMRTKGSLDYVVVSRHHSLYKILGV